MIVVDASVLVAVYRLADLFHDASRAWLLRYLASAQTMIAPLLIVPELAGAISRRTGQPALGHDAVRQFRATPRLTLLPLDETIATHAAELAADLQLHGADAVYVAVAALHGAPLITWDREQIERGGRRVTVRRPDDRGNAATAP